MRGLCPLIDCRVKFSLVPLCIAQDLVVQWCGEHTGYLLGFSSKLSVMAFQEMLFFYGPDVSCLVSLSMAATQLPNLLRVPMTTGSHT
jgi:hypothetical protein